MRDPRSLRVGLVCPYSFDTHGGVQNHVLGLARHLRDQGHRPQVLAPGRPGPDLVDPGELTELGFCSVGAALPVPYNGSVARVSFGPVVAHRVRRWLAAGRFDLVHLHEPVTPSIALLALASATVPVVATYHTATPRSRTMQVAGRTLQPLIEKITAGIAVSESARQVVVQHLGRDAVLVPNGFDHARYARPPQAPPEAGPAAGPWRGGARPRVTFIGRLDEPRKGLDVLLAAAPAVRAALGDVEIVVAGHGSRVLPTGVRSLGAVDEEDKRALLAGTDVFVAPHRARESFGIVLLEALAGGARVVASALPAFVDLLAGRSPQPLGRLVPVGDAAALAAAVVAAVRECAAGPLGTGLGVAAAARYDWSVVGPEIRTVYRACVASTQPAPAAADRLHRARDRSRRSWQALDSALAGRARSVLGDAGGVLPTAVRTTAQAALRPGLAGSDRERAESELTHALRLAGWDADARHPEATLARRLHNDAVAAVRDLERRAHGSAATAGPGPRSFEMAEL